MLAVHISGCEHYGAHKYMELIGELIVSGCGACVDGSDNDEWISGRSEPLLL